MNFQDFNPNNKITFRSGNYLTSGYSFKTILENEGIEYFSTEESKFSDGDYFLYFKDKDYEKAISLYNKFIDESNSVMFANLTPELENDEAQSESLDIMAKFMRNSTLQIILAIIVVLIGMYFTNLFSN